MTQYTKDEFIKNFDKLRWHKSKLEVGIYPNDRKLFELIQKVSHIYCYYNDSAGDTQTYSSEINTDNGDIEIIFKLIIDYWLLIEN